MTLKQALSMEDAAAAILSAVQRSLSASGREMGAVTLKEAPLLVIPGFDSHCGLEVTVELEQLFEIELEQNIFVRRIGSTSRARSLREVCRALLRAIGRGDSSERS